MDEVLKQVLPKLPVWLIALAVSIYVAVFIAKTITADEAEFLWGAAKARRDHKLRELLSALKAEVDALGAVVPLVNLINCELVDLIAAHNNAPGSVQQRIDKIYQAILAGLAQTVREGGFHRTGLLFPQSDQAGNTVLRLEYSMYYSNADGVGLVFTLDQIPGRVYTSGEFYYCRDIKDDRNYLPHAFSTHNYRSFVCVPVKGSNGTVGVLQIDAVQPNSFSNDDINVLLAFARYIAVLREMEPAIGVPLMEVASGEITDREGH